MAMGDLTTIRHLCTVSQKTLNLVPTVKYLTLISNQFCCIDTKHVEWLQHLLINYKHSLTHAQNRRTKMIWQNHQCGAYYENSKFQGKKRRLWWIGWTIWTSVHSIIRKLFLRNHQRNRNIEINKNTQSIKLETD